MTIRFRSEDGKNCCSNLLAEKIDPITLIKFLASYYNVAQPINSSEMRLMLPLKPIIEALDYAKAWSEKHRVPLWLGEFGSEFGVYDRKMQDWNKGLLEALIPCKGDDDWIHFHPSEFLTNRNEILLA